MRFLSAICWFITCIFKSKLLEHTQKDPNLLENGHNLLSKFLEMRHIYYTIDKREYPHIN